MANFYAVDAGSSGGGGGSGDVVGPATSTDNAVARYDGTTGKLLQNSVVIVGDTGNTTGLGTVSSGEITSSSLTASTALVAGASKQIQSSATTATELGFVHGVTSAIQTQIDSKQSTLTIGNLTDVGTDGITITGGTGAVIGSGTSIAQQVSDASHNGYLSSTDWTTFNGKQASGNYITALTGDVAAAGPGSVAATIANLAVTNAKIANTTIDLTTKVTGILPVANGGTGLSSLHNIQGGGSDGITVSGGANTIVGVGNATISQQVADTTHNGYLLAADWNTFNGKVSATLTSTHILVGNGSNVATDVAVTGDISLTNAGVTAYSGTVPLNKGGTGQTTKAAAFDALSPMSASGDVIYGGTSGTGTKLAKGSDTQVLTLASGLPSWATPAITTYSNTTGNLDNQFTGGTYSITRIQNLVTVAIYNWSHASATSRASSALISAGLRPAQEARNLGQTGGGSATFLIIGTDGTINVSNVSNTNLATGNAIAPSGTGTTISLSYAI